MKRFLSVLFVGAVLLSGNVFGMEKVAIERVKFEDNPGIMQRVRDANLIGFVDFEMLQGNVDNLNTIVQNVSDKKLKAEKATIDEIDTLLCWLLVFDGTNHEYETLIAKALDLAIKTQGNATVIRPFELLLLEKGKDLQGEFGKKYIEALGGKEKVDKGQFRRPLTGVEKTRKARDIIKTLKTISDESFNDQLGSLSVDCLSGINGLAQQILKKDQVSLNIWNEKMRFVEEQYVVEKEEMWDKKKKNAEQQLEQKRQHERHVAEQLRQAEEQEKQRVDQLAQELRQAEEQKRQQQQALQEQQRQAEEQRQQQIRQQQELEAQLRQAEAQRSQQQTAEERREEQRQQRLLLEKERAAEEEKNSVIEDEPAVDGPKKPAEDKPNAGRPAVYTQKGEPKEVRKSMAAGLMTYAVPRWAIAAVVVGVCYWGYTKYKARKAAQIEEQEKKKEQEEKDATRKNMHVTPQARKKK